MHELLLYKRPIVEKILGSPLDGSIKDDILLAMSEPNEKSEKTITGQLRRAEEHGKVDKVKTISTLRSTQEAMNPLVLERLHNEFGIDPEDIPELERNFRLKEHLYANLSEETKSKVSKPIGHILNSDILELVVLKQEDEGAFIVKKQQLAKKIRRWGVGAIINGVAPHNLPNIQDKLKKYNLSLTSTTGYVRPETRTETFTPKDEKPVLVVSGGSNLKQAFAARKASKKD